MNYTLGLLYDGINMPKLLFAVFMLWSSEVSGQEMDIQAIRKETLNEGLFLYRLEKSSWTSTDILLKDYSNLLARVNGYLSYPDGYNTKTIFWNEENKVLLTITFDSVYFDKKPNVDDNLREPTAVEADLIKLRNDAFELLVENKDEFFKFYDKTSPNLIPIIKDGQRTVFILTGSQENTLLIGNDYRLVFNERNEIISKVRLHNTLIRIDQADKAGNEVGSVHTHVIESLPYMTSTDICTFLLYKDFFKLKNHVVISDKWTSIFDADKISFVIVPRNNSKEK